MWRAGVSTEDNCQLLLPSNVIAGLPAWGKEVQPVSLTIKRITGSDGKGWYHHNTPRVIGLRKTGTVTYVLSVLTPCFQRPAASCIRADPTPMVGCSWLTSWQHGAVWERAWVFISSQVMCKLLTFDDFVSPFLSSSSHVRFYRFAHVCVRELIKTKTLVPTDGDGSTCRDLGIFIENVYDFSGHTFKMYQKTLLI